MASKYLYILACGHVNLRTTESMTEGGYRCGDPKCKRQHRRVVGVHVFEWHASCTQCRWGRWCGISEVQAQTSAQLHANRTSHDTMAVYEVNPEGRREIVRLKNRGIIKM